MLGGQAMESPGTGARGGPEGNRRGTQEGELEGNWRETGGRLEGDWRGIRKREENLNH